MKYQDSDVKVTRWTNGELAYQLPVEGSGEYQGPEGAGIVVWPDGSLEVAHYWVKKKSGSFPPDTYPVGGSYPEHLKDAVEFLEQYIKRQG